MVDNFSQKTLFIRYLLFIFLTKYVFQYTATVLSPKLNYPCMYDELRPQERARKVKEHAYR